MKTRYEAHTVKETKTKTRYYVINVSTGQVQSVWATLIEARQVARDLNKWSK